MFDLLFGTPDQSFFDSYWTLIHFFSGVATGFAIIMAYRMHKRPLSALVYGRIGVLLLILWEYFEMSLRFLEKYNHSLAESLKVIIPKTFFGLESRTNIIADLAVGSIGLYLIYQYLCRHRSPKKNPS